MLEPIANSADYILAIGQLAITVDMMPTVWHQFRAKACSIPLISSIITTAVLAAFGVVFLALSLYFAMTGAVLGSAIWAVVAAQRVAYGAPQKEEQE